VWAGACAGELLGLRGGLECSDLDYLRSALDGKRGALERQPTKHVRTHTHKLKPLNHFTVVPHPLSPLRFNTPLAADDELDGLSSLSVDEGGPDDGGDGARRAWRRRRWPLEGTAFRCRRSAPLPDRGRAGRAAGKAVTVKADPFRVAPPVRGRSPDVPDAGSGGAGPPALAVPGEGPWAAARARATAAPGPGTGVPSDAAVDASSAASRNT